MTAWLALLARELRLSVRHGADTLAAVLFFAVAGALFPLAIGPAPETLGRMAPGIVWVCALLAALLPLDRLFGVLHGLGPISAASEEIDEKFTHRRVVVDDHDANGFRHGVRGHASARRWLEGRDTPQHASRRAVQQARCHERTLGAFCGERSGGGVDGVARG